MMVDQRRKRLLEIVACSSTVVDTTGDAVSRMMFVGVNSGCKQDKVSSRDG